MTQTLTLYQVEDGLAELLEARQQTLKDLDDLQRGNPPADPEDIAEAKDALAMIEKTLAEYQSLEVRKVDNCHRFLTSIKHLVPVLKAEAAAITARARRLEASGEWLKERIMQAMELGGKKRVDGESGRYLMRKGNGGLAKLHVDGWDEEKKQWSESTGVLPGEFIDVTVRMKLSEWETRVGIHAMPHVIGLIRSEPSQDRIREALAMACQVCDGQEACHCGEPMNGYHETHTPVKMICDACDGTGKNKVPGARLLDRGQHLEVK